MSDTTKPVRKAVTVKTSVPLPEKVHEALRVEAARVRKSLGQVAAEIIARRFKLIA